MSVKIRENYKYAMACVTSMGVRITPEDRMATHNSDRFYLQTTSAESNVLNISSSLGMPCLVMTKFVEALDKFVGKHNYINFTSKEEDEDNYVREIFDIRVSLNETIDVDIIGDGFMRYMIRDIIGTCLAVASGKEDLTYISDRLDKDVDAHTAYRASSEGLFLIDVIYK